MKRHLKNSIYFLVILAVLIVVFYGYEGSQEEDAPLQESLDEILVEGLNAETKLNNLARLFNSRNDGYKVALNPEVNPLMGTLWVRIDIAFDFNIESRIAAREKVNKTIGEIAIVTALLNPWEILIITHDYLTDAPSGDIVGYRIRHGMLQGLKEETDTARWSLYSEIPLLGSVSLLNIGPVDMPDPEEDPILIPNK